jgi:hypothetical protein
MTKASIVIPCCNEKNTIEKIVEQFETQPTPLATALREIGFQEELHDVLRSSSCHVSQILLPGSRTI